MFKGLKVMGLFLLVLVNHLCPIHAGQPGQSIGTAKRFTPGESRHGSMWVHHLDKFQQRKIHGGANFWADPAPAKVQDPNKNARQKIRDFAKVCGAFSHICGMRAKGLKAPEIVVSGPSEHVNQ